MLAVPGTRSKITLLPPPTPKMKIKLDHEQIQHENVPYQTVSRIARPLHVEHSKKTKQRKMEENGRLPAQWWKGEHLQYTAATYYHINILKFRTKTAA